MEETLWRATRVEHPMMAMYEDHLLTMRNSMRVMAEVGYVPIVTGSSTEPIGLTCSPVNPNSSASQGMRGDSLISNWS